jgi:hypothetical protein
MVSIGQVKAAVAMVNAVGGMARLNEVLDLVKDVGGVKKFKDLLEAISGAEPGHTPL